MTEFELNPCRIGTGDGHFIHRLHLCLIPPLPFGVLPFGEGPNPFPTYTTMAFPLQSPPISKLHHQGPVLHIKGTWDIIIGVNNKQIRSGFETPLEPGI